MSRGRKLGGREQGKGIKACAHLVCFTDLVIQHSTTARTNGANVSIWEHDKTRFLFSHLCFPPKKSYYLNESHENTFSVVFYRVCSFTSGAGFPSKWGLGLLRACFPLSSFPHSHSQWSIRCSASRPFKTKQHQGICGQHCQCKCQDSAPRTLNKYSW